MVSIMSFTRSVLIPLVIVTEIHSFIPYQPFTSKKSDVTNLYSHKPNKAWTDTRREWLTKLIGAAAVGSLGNANAAASTALATKPSIINAPAGSALCDPTVSSWYRGSRIIHILGTAHISEESAQVAGKLVREVQPNAVFVELDAKRVGKVIKSNPAKKDISVASDENTEFVSSKYVIPVASTVSSSDEAASASMSSGFNPFGIRDGFLRRAGGALVGDSIRRLYQNLENQGFSAGEEFAIAIREGLNIDATIVLGDQDVNYTLQRLADAISKTDIRKLLSPDSEFEKSFEKILPSDIKDQINTQPELDAKQLSLFVETLKTKENVKLIMNNLKVQAPEIYNAMVGERDLFMATGLDMLENFETTVAVMGLAHLDGVEINLQKRGWLPLPIKCR